MNQDSLAPTNKMAAVGATGALTTLLLYVVSFWGVKLPPEVAAAVTVLLSFAAGYLVQERKPS